MISSLSKVFSFRNIAIDIVILISIYFIPALSHIVPFPLYILDPMRLFLLAGFFLTKQNGNAYILALSIPLFSSLVTGHPPLFKAILISIELYVNILLFVQLLNRANLHFTLSLFASIIGSKLVYYALKYAFINFGLVEGELITTDLEIQLGTMVFMTLIFSLVWISSGQKSRSELSEYHKRKS